MRTRLCVIAQVTLTTARLDSAAAPIVPERRRLGGRTYIMPPGMRLAAKDRLRQTGDRSRETKLSLPCSTI